MSEKGAQNTAQGLRTIESIEVTRHMTIDPIEEVRDQPHIMNKERDMVHPLYFLDQEKEVQNITIANIFPQGIPGIGTEKKEDFLNTDMKKDIAGLF